jgi:hypothetical protein
MNTNDAAESLRRLELDRCEAMMTGRQLLEAVRKGSGERVRIDSRVIQVWVRESQGWQQIAFQTTPTEFEVLAAG